METGVEDFLGLKGDRGPVRVGSSGESEVGEIPKELGLLRGGMIAPMLSDGNTSAVPLHGKLADIGLEQGLLDFKGGLGSVERQDEIVHRDVPLRPAQVDPLLVLRLETAVKRARDSIGEFQFGGETDGDRIGTVGATRFSDHVGSNLRRHLVLLRPENEPDAIPAEVAQASEGFEIRMHPDVFLQEILRSHEAELRRNSLETSDRVSTIQFFAESRKPIAVHEHDAVHELDALPVPSAGAGVDDFTNFRGIDPARFLAEDMFPGLGGLDCNVFPNPGRKRNVDGIDIVGLDDLLVAAAGAGSRVVGHLGLVLVDVLLRPFLGAARDGNQLPVATVPDGVPVFSGYLRGADDSPAAK